MRLNRSARCVHSSPTSQRGVALILVLLLLAIMVSIAATMSERLFTQFSRATNRLNYQQAYWYSIGVEALAKVAIEQSYKDSDTVNLSQPWAQAEQTYPLDYGTVVGHIIDKQACFNLNVLAGITQTPGSTEKPFPVKVLMQLLESLEVDSYQAEVIADSAWEFIDSDNGVDSSYGVEDNYYESLTPAYLAPNGVVADSSELRAVQQVSRDIMLRLAPFVCAVPSDDWRLNINTISVEQAKLLVAMFSPYLSESAAVTLIESRPYAGWDSIADFLAQRELADVSSTVSDQAFKYLAVDSHYFELDAQILVDKARLRIRSLLYSQDRQSVAIIGRRFGGVSERISHRTD
jgi:general secretion pathway protein K